MPDFKNTVGGRFLTMLEAQAPANFAMVMSTGIVSVALHLLDYPIGARLLFWLNAALCVGLALLYIIRLFVFPKRFVQDFRSHGAGPGFLTGWRAYAFWATSLCCSAKIRLWARRCSG